MNLQFWSQLHSGSHAASRLTLGQTLLALKHQNAHKNLGYHHFSHFLHAEVLLFRRTILRQAMHLAERTELHDVLYLGIARLNELLRLNPGQALQLLKEGTPSGAVVTLSVRKLRCVVESIKGSGSTTSLVLGSYLPDTLSGHPSRWEALTERLEMLEVLAGQERTSFQVQLQGFNRPLAECEMAVVYLDRMFANQKEHQPGLSLSRALARILTGRDHTYNARKLQLLRLLATVKQSASKKVSAFWKKLYTQVCPPPSYQDFLSQMVSEVQQQTWTLRCHSPYQAEYFQHCLQDPVAGVFWGTACNVLDVHSLRICWQEGRVEQEKVITPKVELAGVA
jgi:hypothetical protein